LALSRLSSGFGRRRKKKFRRRRKKKYFKSNF